jgi:hypothetical protein
VRRDEIDAMLHYFSFVAYREVSAARRPHEARLDLVECIYDVFVMTLKKGFPGYTYGAESAKVKLSEAGERKRPMVLVAPIVPPRDVKALIANMLSIDPLDYDVTEAQFEVCERLVDMHRRLFDASVPAYWILLTMHDSEQTDDEDEAKKCARKSKLSPCYFRSLPFDVVRYILILYAAVSRARDRSMSFPSGQIILQVLNGQFAPLTADFLSSYNAMMMALLRSQNKMARADKENSKRERSDEKRNCSIQ